MDCGTRINHPRHDDVVLLKRRAARWSDLPEGVKHSIFDYLAPLQYLFVAGVSREFKQLYEEHQHGDDKRTSLLRACCLAEHEQQDMVSRYYNGLWRMVVNLMWVLGAFVFA